MKKILTLSFCLLVCLGIQAQTSPKEKFQKLYEGTVAKISSEDRDTVEFRVFRMNDFSVTRLVYEKEHECLCNSKQCHGPRLTLTANFGKTKIFIFPNGDCFPETNHFTPGVTMVKVDMNEEKITNIKFKKAAEETLLNYLKL